VTGQCLEVPSEPAESGYCKKIKLKSYPLVEQGDILWVYMGPADQQPPLPEWEFNTVPAEQTYTSKRLQECNYLQAMEGGIDSSHVSFLHSGALNTDPLFKGSKGNEYNLRDKMPVFEVVESDGGLYIGARRNAENGNYYWRITPWVMPCFTMVPPRGDHPMHGHFWVPIDDQNCWAWSFDYHPARSLTEYEREAMIAGKGIHVAVDKNFRPLQNKDNDYLMDRAAQKAGKSFSGHRWLRHAGRVGAGKHGSDPGPHEGEPRVDRQRDHHGAPPAHEGREGARRQGNAAARPRSGPPEDPLGLRRAARGNAFQGRRRRSAQGEGRRRTDVRLMDKVLAAVRTGPSKTEIREFPMPDIPADSALLKMEVAGICGTDVKLYKTPPSAAPVIMGHENIGVIAESGTRVHAPQGLQGRATSSSSSIT
jgi:hypothetical protein